MITTGTLLGYRDFTAKGKNGELHGREYFVQRSFPDSGVTGAQVDVFALFDPNVPSVLSGVDIGDNVMYNFYFANGRRRGGFICANPQA